MAKSPSKAETPNVKPEAEATVPNEAPALHVLVAAEHQDRKDTEDLLAGFDRPGRGPKKPPADRDFVDYYAKKKGGADSARVPVSTPPVGAAPPRQIDVSTVVKPRKKQGMPGWVAWAGAVVLMLGIGGVVAYLATGDASSNTKAPTGPGAATTITAATPLQSSRDIVPPPDPTSITTTPMTVSEPAPAVADPPTRGAARRAPAAASAASTNPSALTSPSADRKPPPRDDFIRDL